MKNKAKSFSICFGKCMFFTSSTWEMWFQGIQLCCVFLCRTMQLLVKLFIVLSRCLFCVKLIYF